MSAHSDGSRVGLLIAAHGERTPGADNESVWRIARAVSAKNLVSQTGVGFIKGAPTIKAALAALTTPDIMVYPLFASSGYFTRDRLVQLLDEANDEGRRIDVLPPLGLDPRLPQHVARRAIGVARDHGFALDATTVVMLAHGSRRNSASREATELVGRRVRDHAAAFRDVRIALLEEPPFLGDALKAVRGPAVVVGLFSGEGLHGAKDAPRLIAELGRNDVAFAGVIGSIAGVEDLVARAVADALAGTVIAAD